MQAKTTLKTMDIESIVSREILDRSFNRSGLCAYCANKMLCVLSNDRGLVFDCCDYEPGEEYNSLLTFSTLGLSLYNDTEESAFGLCCECQKKDTCQLKDLSGGVWHCEEYIS